MKLTINITKEVLELSMFCDSDAKVGQNCAIGRAIFDIFGARSWVSMNHILLYAGDFFKDVATEMIGTVELPGEAIRFIRDFDNLSPAERLFMEPFSFDIDIQDVVLEQVVDISEIHDLIKNARFIEINSSQLAQA